MKIHNQQEFEAESERISLLNELALEFWEKQYAGKWPTPKPGTSFHSSPDPTHVWAWEMACIASRTLEFHDDPEGAVDALDDALNAQIDPCEADKAARLDAA